jgi:quinol monooxygenase YgiN
MAMELHIFARFHAREDRADEAAALMREVTGPTSAEPGCLEVRFYRGTRDPRLFHLHSRWRDEAAFEHHATLPHTVRFLERIAGLVDHPLEIIRARAI